MELSSLSELESGKCLKVKDSVNKNNCGQTSDSLSCPSPTKEHLEALTSEFADVPLEEQAQDSESIQLDNPKKGSAIHDITV